jgi:hypothetical protein
MSVKSLSSLGILYTDRRDFYISPNQVKELWTDVTPFTTILANKEIRNVQDVDYKMFEHRSGWIRQEFALNDATPPTFTTGAAGETCLENLTIDGIHGLSSAVDNSYRNLVCEVWNSAKATYKGLVCITDVSSGKLVVKSLGNPRVSTNLLSALADNDIFQVVGTAFGEGTYAPEGFSDELEVVYNSPQIFKTSIEITGTLYAAALRGYSSELERLRIEKNKEHKIQKEFALLRGVRVGGTGMSSLAGTDVSADSHQTNGITDKDGKVIRSTMGIVPTIYRYGATSGDQQNIFTISAASYSYTNFVDDMEKVFQYLPESGEMTALCGAGALSYWSKVDATNGFVKKSGFAVQMDAGTQRDTLGFNFRRVVTPHGNLKLVYAPGLRDTYRNTMLVIDQENLFLTQYRAPKFMANIKTDDAYDGIKDMLFSDEGLGMTLIERHKLFNITA